MTFLLFLAAASIIALSPGPGILYVAARTLAGGRGEGLASSLGTAIGGLVHVAGRRRRSLRPGDGERRGLHAAQDRGRALPGLARHQDHARSPRSTCPRQTAASARSRAFRDGIVVEALNPKTAAFFLAFLPQFVDPSAGAVWLQFLGLGLVSVILNTAVDVVVVVAAARARSIALGPSDVAAAAAHRRRPGHRLPRPWPVARPPSGAAQGASSARRSRACDDREGVAPIMARRR